MRAILVLNEMPENCGDCDQCILCLLDNGAIWECKAKKRQTDAHNDERPDWCPLKEAPEHALIWDTCDDDYNMGYNAALDEILGGDTDGTEESD